MTLEELKTRVIFQVNADEDDLDDYEPALTGYINRGYDRLLWALLEKHLPDGGFVALGAVTDVPKVPEWTHGVLADFATYLVYRNGNPQKQSRGERFLQSFMEVEQQLKQLAGRIESYDDETGEFTFRKDPPQFYHVYP